MEFVIIILGFIVDRVTKLLSMRFLKAGDIPVIKNYFDLQYVENRGAAFGILQDKQIILGLITLAVVIGIIFYLVKNKPTSRILRLSLALIISGALGNLFDRFYYKYVVDFLLFHWREVYSWPNFNAADILVVVGTLLMALYIVRDVKE
ncbi:MAG: signal peptidase II [Bacillota bacterium]|nr:signal peptidase II [Bacillota bacterium]